VKSASSEALGVMPSALYYVMENQRGFLALFWKRALDGRRDVGWMFVRRGGVNTSTLCAHHRSG
jgi:hypothetical protein